MKSLLFVVPLCVASLQVPSQPAALREDPVAAEESPAQREERKVRKLLEVMRSREAMEAATKASSEAFAKMGLPDSFTEEFLDRFDFDRMIDLTVEIYVDELEEETIDAAIVFFESEQGQVLAGKMPDITVRSMREGQKYGEELATDILQNK